MIENSKWYNKVKKVVESIEQPVFDFSYDKEWESPTNDIDSDLLEIKKQIEAEVGTDNIPLSIIKKYVNNDAELLAKILPLFGYNKVDLNENKKKV